MDADGELEAVEGPAPLLQPVRQPVDVELVAIEGHYGHLQGQIDKLHRHIGGIIVMHQESDTKMAELLLFLLGLSRNERHFGVHP